MDRARSIQGLLYAFGAYLLWGVFPIYWKLLRAVPAGELLAHRVFWSFCFLAAVLTARRGDSLQTDLEGGLNQATLVGK